MAVIVGTTAALGYMNDDDDGEGDGTTTKAVDNEIATARFAQSISFTVCLIGLSIVWGVLFKKRSPLRQIPSNTSLCGMGVRQILRTVRKINNQHLRLKWFYVSIMFSDPALMALTILAITFYTDTLQFSGQQNGAAMLIMMIAAIPGAYLGSFITTKTNQNAVISSMIGLGILIVSTVLVVFLLDEPGGNQSIACKL
jgi:MFS-type transporter involved in bile tolerance (Atg22 family)